MCARLSVGGILLCEGLGCDGGEEGQGLENLLGC